MANFKTPEEMVEYTIEAGYKKSQRRPNKTFLLGVMGGIAIAFGAVGNVILTGSQAIDKFLGAAVFPVGLMMIVILGFELFTSNTMIDLAVFDKRISWIAYAKNLGLVYIANFVGAFLVGGLTVITESLSPAAIERLTAIALHKVEAPVGSIFLKGILCNLLVCGAVLMAYAAKDIASKILAIWFPIMLFILLGYDHCVANMLYLPTALLLSPVITPIAVIKNLVFATLGNLVGGGLIMTGLFYSVYRTKKR